MKQEISALMDGELYGDDAEVILDKLKRNPNKHEEWHTYHLISDVLRQSDNTHTHISIAIHKRLQAEPTTLSPRNHVKHNARWFALSAAASVMAVTLVAWLSVQVGPETAPRIAIQQSNTAPSASLPTNGLDDYMMAHQEFSPSLSVHGMTSYVHAVSSQQEGRQP